MKICELQKEKIFRLIRIFNDIGLAVSVLIKHFCLNENRRHKQFHIIKLPVGNTLYSTYHLWASTLDS